MVRSLWRRRLAEIRLLDYFKARWQVFWATTYTFEPRDFEDFLLFRLGQPPLNATVLADFRRLQVVYDSAARQGEGWSMRRINSDYLVRGVPWPTGAFHPKTYFMGDKSQGVLLVGSGNLGLSGLDGGKEVFVAFDSGTPNGDAAIAVWRDWMQDIVAGLAQDVVTQRWHDAIHRVPWIGSCRPEGSLLTTNYSKPFIDQIKGMVDFGVESLHVLAPFYDQGAQALLQLVSALKPGRLHLYVSGTTSVDGGKLQHALGSWQDRSTVHWFEGSEFIHAKLIGVVGRESGLIFSGSPNLSTRALCAVAASGNMEVEVLCRTSPDAVINCFAPPGIRERSGTWLDLQNLKFRPTDEGAEPALRLLSARWRHERLIEVRIDGARGPRLQLTDGTDSLPLTSDVTTKPWPAATIPVLIWLVDLDSGLHSNAIPIDDPAGLARALSTPAIGAPAVAGLDATDLATPVGQMLWQLSQECIFDFDQMGRAAQAALEEGDDVAAEGDKEFWNRLQHEELLVDRRTHGYLRWRSGGDYLDDDVFRLLRIMLDQVPGQPMLHLVGHAELDVAAGSGQQWTPEVKLQLRLFNVLERWILAIRDSRLGLISAIAPVRNYGALLTAVNRCWAEGHLAPGKAIKLLALLLQGLLGKTAPDGVWGRLGTEDRALCAEILREAGAPGLAGALVFASLTGSGPDVVARVFEWQQFLRRGLSEGLISAVGSAKVASALTGATLTDENVGDQLLWASEYIDDPHWAAEIQDELGLTGIEVTNERVIDRYGMTLLVDGSEAWLKDNRLVSLVRRAFEYRPVSGLVLTIRRRNGQGRLSVRLGDYCYAMEGLVQYLSRQPLDMEAIKKLETSGAGWSGSLEAEGIASSAN